MTPLITFFIIGILLISLGANVLVQYTERISKDLNISYFFSSLVFIGLATSSPEVFISIISSLENKANIAVGNALGSNIANIALVFALSVFFIRITGESFSKIFTKEVKIFVGYLLLVTLILILILLDGKVTLIDSIVLMSSFIIFLIFMKSNNVKQKGPDESYVEKNILKNSLMIVLSILILLFGTRVFLDSATEIAYFYGIPDYVIGLSLTAIGTSIPELATAIESARKNNIEFIVGNVLGSNIFNIVLVLGLVGFIDYEGTNYIDSIDFLRDMFMILSTTVLLIIISKNYNIYLTRLLNIMLFSAFIIYQYNLYVL